MKNKIALSLIFLGIIALGIFFWDHKKVAEAPADQPIIIDASSTPVSTTEAKPAPAVSVSKAAWTTFSKYLESSKAHDLAGLKAVTYELSATCKDPSKTKECNELMDNAWFFGSELKEKDFTHIWYDSRQAILSTDYSHPDKTSTTTSGLVRGIVYLSRDKDGSMKIISFSPFEGSFFTIGVMTPGEVQTRLNQLIKDSDTDGVPDEIETCTYPGVDKALCKPTDPSKRDTDGNGWWDSIDPILDRIGGSLS